MICVMCALLFGYWRSGLLVIGFGAGGTRRGIGGLRGRRRVTGILLLRGLLLLAGTVNRTFVRGMVSRLLGGGRMRGRRTGHGRMREFRELVIRWRLVEII